MAAGTLLGGRYELRNRLGAGGAGTVWSAFDTTLRREVAVKLISVDGVPFAEMGSMVERFRREAQAVAMLNHPNVVTAYDFGLHDEDAYLVMERIVGVSLAEHLRRIQATGAAGFDEPTVVRIGRQVCAGLAIAHRARLVHRDLKPSNLMLVEATGVVKIVDFGIARAEEQSRLTATGSYLGTLPYVAPEQMGADPVDGRADLYSLGCVLHELASGRSPYEAQTPMQWMAAHQYGTPAPLRSHIPAASAGLEALLLRLLEKKPGYRPAGADEVGQALARMVATQRVIGGPELDTGAHLLARLAAGVEIPWSNVARPVPPDAGLTAPETPVTRSVEPAMSFTGPTDSGVFTPPLDPPDTGGPRPGTPPLDPGTLTGAGMLPVTALAGRAPADLTPPPSAYVSPPAGIPVSPATVGLRTPPPVGYPPPAGRTPAPPRPRGPAQRPPEGRPRPRASGGHPVPAPARRRRTGLWVFVAVLLLLGGAAGVVAYLHPFKHRRPAAQPQTSAPAFVPSVGDCFVSGWASASDADASSVWAASDRSVPVSCAGAHTFEVVSVQDVDRPAGTPLPPVATSPLVRTIYHACVTDADDYLGGDWRGAYAWLGVALPNATAWQKGAHWRACVLVSTATWQGTPTTSTSSLRDGLRGDRPAALRCFTGSAGTATSCTGSHTDEVVGVFRAAAGPWPGAGAVHNLARAACATQLAHYLGLAGSAQLNNRLLGWSWWPPDQEQWELGNRAVVCTAKAYTPGGTMRGSVRGIGNADPTT